MMINSAGTWHGVVERKRKVYTDLRDLKPRETMR
jgi:hypothetical protein